MSVRPFQNADLPALLQVWLQHWSSCGPPPHVNTAMFEQAILARQFFRPSNLLVSESEGRLRGFVSFSPSRREESATVVCALCFAPSPADVGQELLEAVETFARQAGKDRLDVGFIRDQEYGYAGLDPIGHGFGVPLTDMAANEVLRACGFTTQASALCMTASTPGFRPPVSREAMQFRRSARIVSQSHIYDEVRRAAAMSHFDVESSRLTSATGEQLASIKLWYSDPEAEVMSPSMAILDLEPAHERGRLDAAESYLIASLIQTLEQRRVMRVETSIDSDKSELITQLQGLRFQVSQQGAVWEKGLR